MSTQIPPSMPRPSLPRPAVSSINTAPAACPCRSTAATYAPPDTCAAYRLQILPEPIPLVSPAASHRRLPQRQVVRPRPYRRTARSWPTPLRALDNGGMAVQSHLDTGHLPKRGKRPRRGPGHRVAADSPAHPITERRARGRQERRRGKPRTRPTPTRSHHQTFAKSSATCPLRLRRERSPRRLLTARDTQASTHSQCSVPVNNGPAQYH